jgi:hypothetical protein
VRVTAEGETEGRVEGVYDEATEILRGAMDG